MKKLVNFKLLFLFSLTLLSACNTIEGMGADIQSASRGAKEQF